MTNIITLSLILVNAQLLLLIPGVSSFNSFQLPSFKLPWQQDQQQETTSKTPAPLTSVTKDDTVLILGGTGGIGQLTTKKLLSRGFSNVRVTSRSRQKGEDILAEPTVDVRELNLIDADDDTLEQITAGVSAVVIATGTTAFPTSRWKGGNTPQNVDQLATEKIMRVLSTATNLKKVILVTSVGIERTKEMPFLFLNAFGVLDCKKAGEEAVRNAAEEGGFDYVIVRPGRLVGGPYTNVDIAGLLQIDGGAENGVTLEAGDSLLGDCKRDACAEAVVQSLLNPNCKNVIYSMVTTDGKALTEDEWNDAFLNVRG